MIRAKYKEVDELPVNIYRDMNNKEHIEKFKKYEAEYTRYLNAKYFSDKDIYGGTIFEKKTIINGMTIRESRWPGTRSYADPATFHVESGNSSSGADDDVGMPTNILNGKHCADDDVEHPVAASVAQAACLVRRDLSPAGDELEKPVSVQSEMGAEHLGFDEAMDNVAEAEEDDAPVSGKGSKGSSSLNVLRKQKHISEAAMISAALRKPQGKKIVFTCEEEEDATDDDVMIIETPVAEPTLKRKLCDGDDETVRV